ncbi:MAG: hypothetical protein MJA84_05825 [Firmicutes bacterium]|nr:hypothetical protein [Bacillota bacterium]
MTNRFSGKTPNISLDQQACNKHSSKPKRAITERLVDTERGRAQIFARILIRREGLLTDNIRERGYLATLCRYISEYGFNGEQLGVTQTLFAIVVRAGRKEFGNNQY